VSFPTTEIESLLCEVRREVKTEEGRHHLFCAVRAPSSQSTSLFRERWRDDLIQSSAKIICKGVSFPRTEIESLLCEVRRKDKTQEGLHDLFCAISQSTSLFRERRRDDLIQSSVKIICDRRVFSKKRRCKTCCTKYALASSLRAGRVHRSP